MKEKGFFRLFTRPSKTYLPSFVTPLAGAFLLQQGQNRLESKSDGEGFLKVSRPTDGSGVFDFAGAGDECLVFRFIQLFEIKPLTFN
jgi:hypothetical protein